MASYGLPLHSPYTSACSIRSSFELDLYFRFCSAVVNSQDPALILQYRGGITRTASEFWTRSSGSEMTTFTGDGCTVVHFRTTTGFRRIMAGPDLTSYHTEQIQNETHTGLNCFKD
jgi:hypothetical protein